MSNLENPKLLTQCMVVRFQIYGIILGVGFVLMLVGVVLAFHPAIGIGFISGALVAAGAKSEWLKRLYDEFFGKNSFLKNV